MLFLLRRIRVFKVGTKFHKDPAQYVAAGLEGALVNILGTKDAVLRRSMYLPFFSQDGIHRAEPLIQEFVNKFIKKLQIMAEEDHVVNLSKGFQCLTMDIIMNYSFHRPLGALDALGFDFPLIVALNSVFSTVHWQRCFRPAFNVLFGFVGALPSWLAAKFAKPLVPIQSCIDVSEMHTLNAL